MWVQALHSSGNSWEWGVPSGFHIIVLWVEFTERVCLNLPYLVQSGYFLIHLMFMSGSASFPFQREFLHLELYVQLVYDRKGAQEFPYVTVLVSFILCKFLKNFSLLIWKASSLVREKIFRLSNILAVLSKIGCLFYNFY